MLLDPTAPRAFVDETFREDSTAGFYVLAAVVLGPSAQDEVTVGMLRLRGRRRMAKLNWSQMDHPQRKAAATQLAGADGLHVAVVGTPVPRRRQERARALCLTALVPDLHERGVQEILIEARTPELDRRDIETIRGVRFGLPRHTTLWARHVPGAEQPLLWAADIVAGAVRADHDGAGEYREILAERIHEIRVSMSC